MKVWPLALAVGAGVGLDRAAAFGVEVTVLGLLIVAAEFMFSAFVSSRVPASRTIGEWAFVLLAAPLWFAAPIAGFMLAYALVLRPW